MNIAHGILSFLDEFRENPDPSVIDRLLDGTAQTIESVGDWANRDTFDDVERFCLFIGHPRSGHSLIGSLLDAHPEMLIAHELHALKHVAWGTSRERLFYRLLVQSRWFADRGAQWSGYKYAVPTQHKGEFTSLKVIGDKKGSGTSRALRRNPNLLKDLWRTVGVPIRVIRIIRHPLDNISTLARKGDAEFDGNGDIDGAIETYFRRCETARAVREQWSGADWLDWLELSHEEFIQAPDASLQKMCHFLGVSGTDDYLADCAGVVFDSPRHSRDKVYFETRHIEAIQKHMSSYPSLDRYEVP